MHSCARTCARTGAVCILRWCRKRWNGSASPARSGASSCVTIRVSRILPSRRANAPSLVTILDSVFASEPLAHWRAELDRHTVTFGVIARIDELPDDPQLNANGVFRAVEGTPGLRTIDSPLHLDGVAKRPAGRAPELGEHGREILRGARLCGSAHRCAGARRCAARTRICIVKKGARSCRLNASVGEQRG